MQRPNRHGRVRILQACTVDTRLLTARTYFSAGCSRSRSCSCATSSNREGLSGSEPISLKNSIGCVLGIRVHYTRGADEEWSNERDRRGFE